MSPRIAILGAGMGGLTLAGLLAREGVEVTVFEQARAFERVGTGIQVGPNAVRVLRRLGLDARIDAAAFRPAHWRNRDLRSGELLNEFALGAAASERFGAPYYVLHRADLHAVLRTAVPGRCIVMDHRLVGIDSSAGGVTLRFANGVEARADLLIAADGLGSRVRAALFEGAEPRYTGRVAYRAVLPAAALGRLELDDNAKWWGPDRHIVIYYLNPRKDEVYFTTSLPDPEWRDESWSAEGDTEELRAGFEGFHPCVVRVLAACRRVHKWAIADRPPLRRWSADRCILLGDACHPMTPYMAQGAAQAMEDAAVLTRCLLHHECEDAAGAARVYEATRRERVDRIQGISHRNEWMQRPTESDWLYGYDACTAPLASPPATRTG